MSSATITPYECDLLSKYIYALCGIQLDQSKAYLLESRLRPLLESYQCQTYGELYQKAKQDPLQRLQQHIVDAISTHETSFFRDSVPFDLLKGKLLPEMLDQARLQAPHAVPCLNIWSAACSTGQEVYSIAISLKEVPEALRGSRVRILGTDISEAAIAQASAGKYNKVEMARGLPPEKIQHYFDPVGASWQVKDELRALVQFRQLNLLGSLQSVGMFDIIFCRNVAIYFGQQERKHLFHNLASHLRPTGALILGATESLQGISERYVRRVYRKVAFYQLVS